MTENLHTPVPAIESIFDEIARLRAERDASARNCTESLLREDMAAAMWFARDSHRIQHDLEDCMRRMRAETPD